MEAVKRKILILGGTKNMIDTVKMVKRMGMSPIVVDDIIGAPAKDFADKLYSINPADIGSLAEIIKCERIGGISAAIDDIASWSAIALCKKCVLPFYIAKKQRSAFNDMEKFVEKCRRFNVPVIDQCEIAALNREMAFSFWQFPLIVKSGKNESAAKESLLNMDAN